MNNNELNAHPCLLLHQQNTTIIPKTTPAAITFIKLVFLIYKSVKTNLNVKCSGDS